MSVGEVVRRNTEGGWFSDIFLMLLIEAALVCLFFVEVAVYASFGAATVAPGAVVLAEVAELGVSRDGTRAAIRMRVQYGDSGSALRNRLMIHSFESDGPGIVVSLEDCEALHAVYSPAAHCVVLGCEGGGLYTIVADECEPTPRWLGQHSGGRIDQIAFSPDGSLLVSLNAFSVEVRHVPSGKLVAKQSTVPDAFRCLTFAADSRHVLLGTASGAIFQWCIPQPAGMEILVESGNPVQWLTCSPGGDRLGVLGLYGQLSVWDLRSRELLWRQPEGGSLSAVRTTFSADGTQIISGYADDGQSPSDGVRLEVRDAGTGLERGYLSGHKGQVTGMAVSKTHQLHTASRDGTVRTWDLRTMKELRRVSITELLR